MTMVIAAYIPWKITDPIANGIVMVSDCLLSAEVAPGVYKTYSDEAKKIFQVTPYMMAAYSGHRRSARTAIGRLAAAFPTKSPLPGSVDEVKKHIHRALRKGAAQARKTTISKLEKKSCGPFTVFVAYQDANGNFALMVHAETDGGPALYHSSIAGTDGRLRMLLMGSGQTSGPDFLASLNRIGSDIALQYGQQVEDMEFPRQAGIVGMALLEVLILEKAPFSGGGLQAMSLTNSGVQAWEIRSSVPEYLTDPTIDPQWERYRAESLSE